MGFIKKIIEEYATDLINEISKEFMNSTFYIPNLFTAPGVQEKFNATKHAANWILLICFLLAIISLLFSLDVFSGARLKKAITDIVMIALMLNIGIYLLQMVFEGVNIFVDLFMPASVSPGGQSNMLLAAVGLAVTGGPIALQALGMALLTLIVVLGGSVILLMITHSIVITMLKILIVIFPLVIATFPFDRFKDYTWKYLALVTGLLALSPLQVLAISLSASQVTGGAFSLSGITASIGMLIVAILIVPLSIFYIVSVASNPRFLD